MTTGKLCMLGKAFRQPRRAISVLRRHGRARAGYLLPNGRSLAPHTVYIDLTNRCNLRCRMCPHWGDLGINKAYSPSQLQDELRTDEVKRVIEEVAAFRPVVTLSGGGETFLHPGAMEIASFVKEKGLYCEIITNGTFLESHAPDLVAAGIDRINVSVDGPRPINDSVRGVKGCFDKLSEGVRRAIAEREKAVSSRPLVYLFFTISSLNYTSMEEMVSIAQDHRVRGLTFLHLRAAPRVVLERYREFVESHLPFVSYESSYWEHFPRDLLTLDWERLSQTITRIKHTEHEVLVEFMPDLSLEQVRSHYDGADSMPGMAGRRCLSPWSAMVIAANGDMTHCYDILIGNVREGHAMAIWNNWKSRRFRQVLKKCGRMPTCHRCPSFYTWY